MIAERLGGAVIVEAVPIVMQWPGERAMPSSISCQSASVMLPGAQLGPVLPDVGAASRATWPRQLPRSIGPAGTKIAGRSIESAPMSSAGVVLSQPPMSTAPSIG